MWFNKSVVTINATFQLLDIYRYRFQIDILIRFVFLEIIKIYY